MKKAIDIVLLPPEDIMDFAIRLNKPWVKGIDDEIELNKKNCLPHITLAMGLMDDSRMEEVKTIMADVAGFFSPLDLEIISVEITTRSDGRKMSGLQIKRSPELQKLHETVMDKLVPLFTYDDVAKEMFYSPPPVNMVPNWWVKGFAKTAVRDKYRPHITLGMGVPEKIDLPVDFAASRLALCHLGNHCTCRKILAEFKLTGSH